MEASLILHGISGVDKESDALFFDKILNMKKPAAKLTVNLVLLLGGLMMAFSGFLIQIEYDIGDRNANESVLGFVYSTWYEVHIFSSIFVVVIMIFHIIQHWKWYKIVFKKRLIARNQQVLILSLIFLLVAITGLIPWGINLGNGNQIIRETIIEIHDKIAILLFFYLVFHVVKRVKWYHTACKQIKTQIVLKRNCVVDNK